MSLQVLGELLSLFLGVLLGATWTDQIMHAKHRRQAEERRQLTEERLRLDEEWAEVRRVRWWRGQCSRCRAARSDRSWYFAEDPAEDD